MMKTTDYDALRKGLKEWIDELDQSTLDQLDGIRFSRFMKSDHWPQEISDQDKLSVWQGLKDCEEGRTMNSKTFWQRLDEKREARRLERESASGS